MKLTENGALGMPKWLVVAVAEDIVQIISSMGSPVSIHWLRFPVMNRPVVIEISNTLVKCGLIDASSLPLKVQTKSATLF